MRDLNKAMKKLQEAKRLESTKLAKLVKESVVEPEDKEETFDNKFNYKVSLDNGKTITATCSKENIEDARKYFLGKSYLNTKTGEKAKIVGVEEINSDENGFEEIKNEEFGSTSKQLTDNDPAQKVPFDSDAKKDIEKAATQKSKIVAEEFGSENKKITELKKTTTNSDWKNYDMKILNYLVKKGGSATLSEIATEAGLPADDGQYVTFETLGKHIDGMADSRVAVSGSESDAGNQEVSLILDDGANDDVKGIQELKNKMDDQATDLDESKKLNEATEEDINNENKLEKAKQLIEVIFNMDSLDETRRAAKQELKDLVYPQRIEPEKTEKKIVKESIFDNDEDTSKEDRLASLKTQLEVDGDQLADDEKEAIQAEIDSLEKDLYESKQLKEDWDDDDDEDEDDEEYELIACNKDNDTLKSLSACIGDYEASMTGITDCPEYQELVKYAENNKEVDKIYIDYPDREYVIWTRVFGDYPEFDSLEEADEAEDEEGYDNLDESKRLKENIANDGRTKGKTLEVIYTDKDGKEKTTHFECDKEYELDGEQIREAIKSSDNDIVDIIKINESKCLTEEDEEKEETLEEIINRAYEEELSAINTYDLVLNKIENEESNEKLIEMINEIKKDEEDHKSLIKHYIETGEALTDDELEELKNSEESNEDNSEEEVSIENIDDETFTEAFTKFIKENYKNAKEFKLENVIKSGNKYKFECKLTFNSGKQVKVNLMSEAKIREGKSLIRFYENKTFKHLDENKSIMTATVKLENKTLSCEALRYNYRVALKENKIATIKGIIK